MISSTVPAKNQGFAAQSPADHNGIVGQHHDGVAVSLVDKPVKKIAIFAIDFKQTEFAAIRAFDCNISAGTKPLRDDFFQLPVCIGVIDVGNKL